MKKLIVICGLITVLFTSTPAALATAQDDYAAAQKKYEDLVEQKEDLENKKADLTEEISELNESKALSQQNIDSWVQMAKIEQDLVEFYRVNNVEMTAEAEKDHVDNLKRIEDGAAAEWKKFNAIVADIASKEADLAAATKEIADAGLDAKIAAAKAEMEAAKKAAEEEALDAAPKGLHLNPDSLNTSSSGSGSDYLIKTESTLTTEQNIVALIEKITDVLLYFVAAVAVLVLILEALKLVAGAGNEDKLAEAKNAITWVALALVIIILSYVIVKTVLTAIFTITAV